jgi:hypothetical protein
VRVHVVCVKIWKSTEHDDLDATGLRAARLPAKIEKKSLVRELNICDVRGMWVLL